MTVTTTSHPVPAQKEARPRERLWSELRAVIVPAARWHYWFHAAVVIAALAYWIGAMAALPEASWAERVMYRPKGDNQVWPVVTALSKFNFGDPTDALNYGRGVGGFHAVILLPYALSYAIFGPAGYMVTDAVLCWCYFVVFTVLLRRCGLGAVSSMALAAAVATSSLQNLLHKPAEILTNALALFGRSLGDGDFPNLFGLTMFDKRIPRPIITEILVVLLLCLFLKLWMDRRAPSLRRGLAVGAIMALLAQGDPYSFSALGLLLCVVVGRIMSASGWKLPWRFIAGGLIGALAAGSYFIYQLAAQHPDGAARFGLVKYSRSHLMFMPRYAPWLRLAVIGGLVALVISVARQLKAASRKEHRHLHSGHNAARDLGAVPWSETTEGHGESSEAIQSLSLFALALIFAAWLAQPVQLFLLGKGAQIYHYIHIFPIFYSYALVLVLVALTRAIHPGPISVPAVLQRRGVFATALAIPLLLGLVLSLEEAVDAIAGQGTSRREINPWSLLGDRYRVPFRALDHQFRTNALLQQTRTFATFNHEVNFLLTAFHDKRACLPDNGFTTLSDDQLERRLCDIAKIHRFSPEQFGSLIQNPIVLNYWLGCAKYWCTSDYRFAPDGDYSAEQLNLVKRLPKQSAFNLVLPRSEFNRMIAKYTEILHQPLDFATLPDVIIMSVILKDQGISPEPKIYREVYKNDVFTIFVNTLPKEKSPQSHGEHREGKT